VGVLFAMYLPYFMLGSLVWVQRRRRDWACTRRRSRSFTAGWP